MSLLAELQGRNVTRMAGLYLVRAWRVVQVAAIRRPVFETRRVSEFPAFLRAMVLGAYPGDFGAPERCGRNAHGNDCRD